MYYVYYFNIIYVIVLQIRDKQMRETPSQHTMDPELEVVGKKQYYQRSKQNREISMTNCITFYYFNTSCSKRSNKLIFFFPSHI